MKSKIPGTRQQNKFLEKLINSPAKYNTGIPLDNDFYERYSEYDREYIDDMLDALTYKNLLVRRKPASFALEEYIYVTEKAYAYIPDYRENIIKFYIPIVISAVLSVAALVISFWSLLR